MNDCSSPRAPTTCCEKCTCVRCTQKQQLGPTTAGAVSLHGTFFERQAVTEQQQLWEHLEQ